VNAKDTTARILTALHRQVFTATKGRLAGKAFGMPVVLLTTTGRTSGEPRSTMLTSPVQDGDTVVLIASYGGDSRDPQWFKNLLVDPACEITMGGRTRPMRARVASAEEKQALWPAVTAAYKGYGMYQKRTDRDIPVVLLEPA
jgi:deazaflavin-dependent oxidoreductase (nitroreductase family)